MSEAIAATFNIRHGRGLDERVDLERTAELITRSRADVIALQEVDRSNPRSGGVDQPAELERLTGLHVSFCPTIARAGWEYGIALASRERPATLAPFDLPRIGGEEPRKAIVARWRGVTVIATHLALDAAANAAQERALAGLAGRHLPRVLLLGDLNRPLRHLRSLMSVDLRPAQARGGTVEPWWRFRRIDHALVGRAISIKRAQTLPTRASDHRPLVVSLYSSVEDVFDVAYDA